MRLITTLATIAAAASVFSLRKSTPAGADEPGGRNAMEISPDEFKGVCGAALSPPS